MAVNFNQFVVQQPEWGGLYKAADTLERRRLRDDEQQQRKDARKHASAQFLQNYLDPKDYMSGTAYDPMIVKGLDEAMQQGAELAAKGVDTPTMMMALGPMVKKLSDYSSRAKTLNTQLDDQIKKMQQSDMTGYDYAALKREALQSAMFDVDPQSGKSTVNPSKADPGVDWISKVLQESPEKVTTNAALDEFAKKSSMSKDTHKVDKYTLKGELDSQKYHTIGQNWLQTEYDKEGRPVEMVPKYEEALNEGKPLTHPFKDQKTGKVTEAPVRMLEEGIFDNLPASAMHRIQALTKEKIKEFKVGGEEISMQDPKAKMVARAIAYDELNRRKARTIEYAGIENKPSTQQIILQNQNTPEYMEFLEQKAAASKRGRESVPDAGDEAKADKLNAGQALGRVFRNDPEFTSGGESELKGKAKVYGSDEVTDLGTRKVINITSALPGGGLKTNTAQGFDYGNVYYDPRSRSLILDKTSGSGFKKKTSKEIVPESKVGQFIANIAESNGIPRAGVRKLLDEIGYKDQKFTGANDDELFKKELEKRKKSYKMFDWANPKKQ
jgi:hypothetical protein